MKKIKLLVLLVFIGGFITSCDSEKSYEFSEPYSNHLLLFDLSNNVKSVTYGKQIFEISDGGYYPVNTDTNDAIASLDYPYPSSYLKYMGRLNNALIFNYPITGNQYLLNELILAELSGENVKIEFENQKIKRYSNKQGKDSYSITCDYDEKGRLVSLDIKSKNNRKVIFKNKGSFLTQVIEQRKEKTDTINFIIEKSDENLIKIKRTNKDILVHLTTNADKKELDRIVYEYDNATIKFNNDKVVESYEIKEDGSYKKYKKLTYSNNVLNTIMSSDPYKKNTVVYNLDTNSNIESISVSTDEKRMGDLGLKFYYELNNKGDWTEMSYSRDREIYDRAKRNVEFVKQRLLSYGYTEAEISFSREYYDALLNKNLAQQHCSKTTINRQLTYIN